MLRIPATLDDETEDFAYRAIGSCIAVHKELGPGLIETIYQRAVAYELDAHSIPFEREKAFPVQYRGHRVYVHKVDLIVANRVLLELKAVDTLHAVHRAQVLSCLRVSKLRLALLINFNVAILPHGVQRVVL